MICAECLMRWRQAAIQATGNEPDLEAGLTAGTAPVAAAATSVQGTALCLTHLVECIQIQRVSSLVNPNGQQIVLPNGVPA